MSESLERNKGMLAMIAVAVLLVGAVYAASTKYTPQTNEPAPLVVCTMEAKQCPDGSYVGRSGPNCAFAPCPTTTTPTSTVEQVPIDWKVATDTVAHLTFRYPETLGTSYISVVDWPPKMAVTNGPLVCTEAGSEILPAGKSESVTVNGHTYCLTRESEGAAGSTYTQYAYAYPKGDKVMILTFTLRSVQCANYDEPKQSDCEIERTGFSADTVADQMAQSVVLQ